MTYAEKSPRGARNKQIRKKRVINFIKFSYKYLFLSDYAMPCDNIIKKLFGSGRNLHTLKVFYIFRANAFFI